MPSGLHWMLNLGSWAIFVNVIVGKLGTDVSAGNTAASQIMHLSFMPTIGLNIGVTALVGRHIGAKNIRRAKRVAYAGMTSACTYMTLMGLLFFIFRRPLIGMFSEDVAVIAAGSIILMYAALFQFSDSIAILSYGALKGAGDTKFPAIISFMVAWFVFLPLGWYLGREDVLGVHGAWLAATIYVWIISAVFFWRFVGESWRKIDIFR